MRRATLGVLQSAPLGIVVAESALAPERALLGTNILHNDCWPALREEEVRSKS